VNDTRIASRTGVVLVAALAAAACGGASRGGVVTAPSPAAPPAAGAADGSTAADSAAYARARADSARRPYTEADIHFISGMIGHHAQAIRMARLAETHGAGPAVRTLAGRILSAQQDEIALMRQWLRDRRLPVPEPTPGGVMMTMGGHTHEMRMPGMLTEEQMRELDAARGKAFDRLFLTYMIQHHRGAVDMVQELLATPGAGHDLTVFKLASDINVDQTTEIARMRQMLAAVLLEGSPPP
jgi:uncharacterized protein (DUF305 family)